MGTVKGFLEHARETGVYLPVEERIRHFREFYRLPSEEGLRVQGARCMDCGIPYCHSWGCPNGNLIPEWNDLVYRGRWREAYDRLAATSSLPEVTGRVCPAPCEASCTLSINSAPVAIRDLELAIIEKAFDQGWVVPEVPARETGKKVAVVGSGPAGLAAARELRRSGFGVTVFEKDDRPGGLLRYGIPNFKLEKEILDRRIAVMEAGGIEFETQVHVGKDLSLAYLQRRFDAVLLALGAGVPRDVPAGGRGLEGIFFALEYLTEATRAVQGGRAPAPDLSAEGKRVLVIGGGDTGSDCVGTAVRQGAREVYQYEIMPEPQRWKEPWNPEWPRWPGILRTSSSQAEGCRRDWGISTRRFSGRDIRVEEAHFVRVEWKPDSRKGGASPVEIPGSEFSQPVDLVLLALGFLHVNPEGVVETQGLKRDGRGNLEVDRHGRTSVPGIWAAGDCGSGASLVIRAMESGTRAAEDLKRQI